MNKSFSIVLLLLAFSGCQTVPPGTTLYAQLGGKPIIEKVADRFVRLIIIDPRVERHFKDTNLDRFYEKLVEHLCQISGGGCAYTGDDMLTVHKGMNISEREFNVIVENLQLALNEAKVPLTAQNQLLARLAPMRSEIIYR